METWNASPRGHLDLPQWDGVWVLLTMDKWRSVIYAGLSIWFCEACWGCIGLNELLELVGQIPNERK